MPIDEEESIPLLSGNYLVMEGGLLNFEFYHQTVGSDFSEAVVQIREVNGWSRPEAEARMPSPDTVQSAKTTHVLLGIWPVAFG
jgi:hypothetical protein